MNLVGITAVLGGAVLIAGLPGSAPVAAATSDLVAVVIDFGTGGPPSIVTCVHDAGQSDAQAITDALAQVGATTGLGINQSGLICSVNGYPTSDLTTACPISSGTTAYWAYFHGTAAGWTYASQGPASFPASPTTTVGFRFESTAREAAANPPPSAAADPVASCPAIATSAPTPSVANPATTIPAGSSTTSTTSPGAARRITSTVAPTTIGRGTLRALNVTGAAPHASSPVGTIVALALFVFLGLGAGGIVWRRRRAP